MKNPAVILLPLTVWAGGACGKSGSENIIDSSDSLAVDSVTVDSVPSDRLSLFMDSVPDADKDTRYTSLTDEDFKIVADELGVEIAAIKAVVLIEAGTKMKGFYGPGLPVINFDPTMYRQVAGKAPDKSGASGEKVPDNLTGKPLKEYTQLINMRKKNAQGALMGTFWGMFQIGGFHYKKCGFESVNDFVKAMSESELAQLEIFSTFIRNSGMLDDLKNKNWSAFARKYNGASYAKRGYHTKMANAYKKFKNTK